MRKTDAWTTFAGTWCETKELANELEIRQIGHVLDLMGYSVDEIKRRLGMTDEGLEELWERHKNRMRPKGA